MKFLSRFIDKRIAAYGKTLSETHFEEVKNMHNEMLGFKHDFSKHISTLLSLAANKDMLAVESYLNELSQDFIRQEKTIKTGNEVADAILSSKISLAKSCGITVKADAEIAVKLSTGAVDLCIILGNLMENAIEACKNLEEKDRLIRIFMEMKNTQLYISVTNTAPAGKLTKYGKKFLTTKGKGRGFGLARIDSVVERLGGYISRNSEDGVYSTEILLPQSITQCEDG